MIKISEEMKVAVVEAADKILATGQNLVTIQDYSVVLDGTSEYHSVDENAFFYTFSHKEKTFHVAIL